ncbi:MAG: hypothetical protein ACI3V2_08430 [Faecousia sp.]
MENTIGVRLFGLKPKPTILHCYDSNDLLWSCYENPFFSCPFLRKSAEAAACHGIPRRICAQKKQAATMSWLAEIDRIPL